MSINDSRRSVVHSTISENIDSGILYPFSVKITKNLDNNNCTSCNREVQIGEKTYNTKFGIVCEECVKEILEKTKKFVDNYCEVIEDINIRKDHVEIPFGDRIYTFDIRVGTSRYAPYDDLYYVSYLKFDLTEDGEKSAEPDPCTGFMFATRINQLKERIPEIIMNDFERVHVS